MALAASGHGRYARRVESERPWSLETLVAVTRADVGHVQSDVVDLKHDVRRVEARIFQLMLATLATLATTLGTLVVTLLSQ